MSYMAIITIFIFLLALFCYYFRNKNGLPTNWPLLGMLPAMAKNFRRVNEFGMEVMEKSELTFRGNGPWFTNVHLLVTADPNNVNHVLSKNFGNYVRGSKLIEILEPFGEGIFNADSLMWSYHRRLAMSFFHHPNFQSSLVDVTSRKVRSGLIPLLDHASNNRGAEIDLQDVFLRLMYDTMSIITMDYDPMSLSVDLPSFPIIKAMEDVWRVFIHRHIEPTWVWKLLRWLNVGEEKKLREACTILDDFIDNCIEIKREKRREKVISNSRNEDRVVSTDLLSILMDEIEENKVPIGHNTDKFIRDTMNNYFLAGGDASSTALSWFFYLLSKNPNVISNIKEELDLITKPTKDYNFDWFFVHFKEFEHKLIYLHAAICETLRLYPSLAFNSKAPMKSDVLPSGHRVDPDMLIILDMYAMGRMKSIWGDDCSEFKPERWISEGAIKHEPTYKFVTFGSGPRTCIGKQMAFTQMKIVAAVVIQNYQIEVLQKNHIPSIGSIIHMKDEFKVKVSRSS